MLSNARMNRRFWAEAANTACYLINRSPSIPLNKKTPIEVWSGMPADYSQLRVFGCTAYAHVDNGKLEPRAIKCLFLGYGSGVKGYKLWNPETKKTFMSRSVVFNESVMFNDSLLAGVLFSMNLLCLMIACPQMFHQLVLMRSRNMLACRWST